MQLTVGATNLIQFSDRHIEYRDMVITQVRYATVDQAACETNYIYSRTWIE